MVNEKHILEGLHNQAEILVELLEEKLLAEHLRTSIAVALAYNITIASMLGDESMKIHIVEVE